MSATLNSSGIMATAKWDFSNTTPPPTASSASSLNPTNLFAAGSGANAANKVIVKTYSIAGGATQAVDVSGAINDPLGTGTVSFTKLRGIMVYLTTDTPATSIRFGPRNGANPVTTVFGSTTDYQIIANGGFYAVGNPTANGYGVTDATADNFLITNNDGANVATVTVVFLGE